MSYNDYLRSDHWLNLRLTAKRIHGSHCHCCGERVGVQLHHLTYSSRWINVTVGDLIPLCGHHHDKLHKCEDLAWLWSDTTIPSRTKRAIALRYLRSGQILSVARAETWTEQSATPARYVQHTIAKPRRSPGFKAKRKPSAADKQAARVAAINRMRRRAGLD